MAEEYSLVQQIVALIGEANAEKLCRAFGGESVYFPKSIVVHFDHEAIRKDFAAGLNYRELSIKYGRTSRQIRDIVHCPKQQTFDFLK